MSRRDLLATALCLGLSGAATGKTPVRKPPTQVVLDYRRQAGAERCPRSPSWSRRSGTSSDALPSPGRRRARCAACSARRAVVSLPACSSWTAARAGCSGCASSPPPVRGARSSAARWRLPSLWRSIRWPDPRDRRPPRRSPPRLPCLRLRLQRRPRRLRRASRAPRPPRRVPEPQGSARRRGPDPRRAAARVPDAGQLSKVGLVPLALAQAPRGPAAASSGRGRGSLADAGTRPADAGTPPVDAGVAHPGRRHPPDAGPPPSDAGTLGATDAGVALRPDAGTGGPATEAGVPVLVAEPAPPRTGWRPVVGVEALGAAGVLPGFAGGVLVHAGAASSTASVELEGRWLPGTTQAFGTGSVSTSLVSGALVGCARFGSWSACGLALAGPVSGEGSGVHGIPGCERLDGLHRGPGTVGVAVRRIPWVCGYTSTAR